MSFKPFCCYSTADTIILKYHTGVLTSSLLSRTWCITGSWKWSAGVEAKPHELWSAADLWTELKHFFLSYTVRRIWTRSAAVDGNSSSWSLMFWSDAGRVLILILRPSLSGWECQTPENTAWLRPAQSLWQCRHIYWIGYKHNRRSNDAKLGKSQIL